MTTPHKHAKLIKLWADGGKVEGALSRGDKFHPITSPSWTGDCIYRVKLADGSYIYNDGEEPKQKVVRWQWVIKTGGNRPSLSKYFYTEKEIKEQISPPYILGKAEWTRMEFDE